MPHKNYNDSKNVGYYKGTEPSPKGKGYCAKYEVEGSIRKGIDGNLWKVIRGKLAKNYNKTLEKNKKSTKDKAKKSTKDKGKKSTKVKKDKYIGKVILVKLPNNKRRRYRWIVEKTHNNDNKLENVWFTVEWSRIVRNGVFKNKNIMCTHFLGLF